MSVSFQGRRSRPCAAGFYSGTKLVAKVLIPDGRQVKGVELVRAGQAAPFTMEGNYAVIRIAVIHIAELGHIGFA